jgi:hypothetical protein
MRGEDYRTLFGRMLQKPAPGGSRLLGLLAECSVPVRAKHLQGLVHDVATEQPLLSAAGELDGNMPTLCPGVGWNVRPLPIAASPSTITACPLSTTGSTLSW